MDCDNIKIVENEDETILIDNQEFFDVKENEEKTTIVDNIDVVDVKEEVGEIITINASDVIISGVAEIRNEEIEVLGLNSLGELQFIPLQATIAIYVNGKAELEGSAFDVTGKNLTWNATNAQYDLNLNDQVVAHYNTIKNV